MKNLDLRNGVLSLLAAVICSAFSALHDGPLSGELYACVLPLAAFGIASIRRYLTRPTDGDPQATMPADEVSRLLGIPVPASCSAVEVERRARAGWVSIDDCRPQIGDRVIAVVTGSVVTGTWGDPDLAEATHWRRMPDAPQ